MSLSNVLAAACAVKATQMDWSGWRTQYLTEFLRILRVRAKRCLLVAAGLYLAGVAAGVLPAYGLPVYVSIVSLALALLIVSARAFMA